MKAADIAPRADSELRAAIRWIAEDNPVAAQGLLDAFVNAAQLIGEYPHIGRVRPDLTAADRYRFLRLTGYPYLIVYVSDRDPPLILRILHAMRDLPPLLHDLR